METLRLQLPHKTLHHLNTGAKPQGGTGIRAQKIEPVPPKSPNGDFDELLKQQTALDDEIGKLGSDLDKAISAQALTTALAQIRTAINAPAGIDTDPAQWQKEITNPFQNALDHLPTNTNQTQKSLKGLDEKLTKIKLDDSIERHHLNLLLENQKQLNAQFSKVSEAIANIRTVLTAIQYAVSNQSTDDAIRACEITDPGTTSDHTLEAQTWNLDAAVPLSDELSQYESTDKVPDGFSSSLALLGKAPTLSTIIPINVTFERSPDIEYSTGVLFPVLPYHSYSIATNSSGTPVVVKTPVWTVVPDAVVNFRISRERAFNETRFAVMLTGAAGYSTGTSSAVFGGGISLAFGSVVINPLVVGSPDTRLTAGFTPGPNPNVPAGVTAPATHTSWSVKPSIGISIRLPL
jgi:hypothetical protein